MGLSRRSVIKLGAGAGAASLLPAGTLSGESGSGPRMLDSSVPVDQRLQARRLPLGAVRLTGGPLRRAQELNATYLLELEPDRMLAHYRQLAGLEAKGEPYGGWDGGGRNLTGHIAGHYLSGVSLMYAATGDERFRERAEYLVQELSLVQERHRDGFVGALQGVREAFARLSAGEIRSSAFDLNGEWSPWYTLHKTFAGLRDAYRFAGVGRALEIEQGFAAWAEGVLAPLDEGQIQHMLNTEFGGMNEVMVDLFEDTGDDRWLALAWKFEHTEFLEPLRRHQDNLGGKHGNTQVPKLLGSADRFALTGRGADLVAAAFFWDQVAFRHSFATGGHGTDEYFGPPGRLHDRIDGRTAETCNVYNMLKLTRRLFELMPDPAYADFHERALFNHILSSIDPEDGRTCYMVPVGRGVQREYQDMWRSFTCCVGSGMESHALHGDGLYYEAEDRLWVNLYVPSTVDWASAGLGLAVDTGLPLGATARLRVTSGGPSTATLSLRRPFWAREGFAVRVNGEPVPVPAEVARGGTEWSRGGDLYAWDSQASDYVELRRRWAPGDVVEVDLPRGLRLEGLPDDRSRASLLWGPLVLAGDLGPERARGERAMEPSSVPVLVRGPGPVSDWVHAVDQGSGRFVIRGAGRRPDPSDTPAEVTLVPFHELHRRTYTTYFDLFSPEEWERQKEVYAEEAERERRLDAATVAFVQPGEPASERRFRYRSSDEVVVGRIEGRPGRRGPGWFSLEIPLEPDRPLALICTYFSDDRRATPATFDILVDGVRLVTQEVGRSEPRTFFDVTTPIPDEMVAGKERIQLRFQAHEGSRIATVFGVRILRAGA